MRKLYFLIALAFVGCGEPVKEDINQLQPGEPVGNWTSEGNILRIDSDSYEMGKEGQIQRGDILYNEKFIVLIDHNFNTELFKYKLKGNDTLLISIPELTGEMVYVRE